MPLICRFPSGTIYKVGKMKSPKIRKAICESVHLSMTVWDMLDNGKELYIIFRKKAKEKEKQDVLNYERFD